MGDGKALGGGILSGTLEIVGDGEGCSEMPGDAGASGSGNVHVTGRPDIAMSHEYSQRYHDAMELGVMLAACSGVVRITVSPDRAVAVCLGAVCLGADDCVLCAGADVGVGVGVADAVGPSSSRLMVASICATWAGSAP